MTDQISTHSHDIKAKERERAEIQRQLEAFAKQGGIPLIIPTNPEKK
jgi:hypothetical protein